jgi:hypothetical protein
MNYAIIFLFGTFSLSEIKKVDLRDISPDGSQSMLEKIQIRVIVRGSSQEKNRCQMELNFNPKPTS